MDCIKGYCRRWNVSSGCSLNSGIGLNQKECCISEEIEDLQTRIEILHSSAKVVQNTSKRLKQEI